jgi:MFS family permease
MAWLVCLSAGLFFFYEFFQLNLFDVINQPLRDEFKIDATQLSWMSSAYLWADILFLLPAGIILDRYSVRTVILTAMCVCIVGTVGFGLTHSFLMASFFHFLSGIGNAFCFLSCAVLVSRWFSFRQQAMVIGCLVTMAFVGGMMAHTPFAYLNKMYGWRTSLLIDGAVGALFLAWMFFFIQNQPNEPMDAPSTAQRPPPHVFTVLTNPQNWLSGLYTACLNLPIMVICALWGASYLKVVHQLSDIEASNTVSLIFFGSMLGCPFMGWMSDRLGRRKPLMLAGAIATLLTTLPLLMGMTLSGGVLRGIFFMLGVFTSTQVITYPLIAESNDSSNTGAATAIASVIIMGGAGIGQIVFGWLVQYHAGALTQHYTVADFQFAMWMFPIAAMAAVWAILFARETYCRRAERL